VILALFVSRKMPELGRLIAQTVATTRSPFVWPVLVTKRDSFATQLRKWAPGATVVTDPDLLLISGLAPLKALPAMALVDVGGRTILSRTAAFGPARVRTLLSASDSASFDHAFRSGLALPESLALTDWRGKRVVVSLPGPARHARPQLWTYSAAGCTNCYPMLRMISPTLGTRDIDWYHLAYRNDFPNGRWTLPGRAPRSILLDDRLEALDAFQVSATPGFVLVDSTGRIRSHASGRDAYLLLAAGLRANAALPATASNASGPLLEPTNSDIRDSTLIVLLDDACEHCLRLLADLSPPPRGLHGVVIISGNPPESKTAQLRRKGWAVQSDTFERMTNRFAITDWPTVLYYTERRVCRRWSGSEITYPKISRQLAELNNGARVSSATRPGRTTGL
jgi:hypothetical protein